MTLDSQFKCASREQIDELSEDSSTEVHGSIMNLRDRVMDSKSTTEVEIVYPNRA